MALQSPSQTNENPASLRSSSRVMAKTILVVCLFFLAQQYHMGQVMSQLGSLRVVYDGNVQTITDGNDGTTSIKAKDAKEVTASSVITCGEPLQRSKAVDNMLDLFVNNPEHVPKYKVQYNRMNHQGSIDKHLFIQQSCSYHTLIRWNQLAMDLGIRQWVAHGGSAMGAKCYAGMNPWDDDIDMTILDCTKLDELWENGDANITGRFPDLDPNSHSMNVRAAIWDSRLVADDLILTKGSRCCDWYKLMTVKEAFLWKPKDHIKGIDIECMNWVTSPRERKPMKDSLWTQHMIEKKQLYTVPFGPTTIQVMNPKILNAYTKLRYGKSSPCQFPFSSGTDPEKFLPPWPPPLDNNTTNNDTSSATTARPNIYELEQAQSQMNVALEKWYVPKAQREEWLSQKGNGKQMEFTKLIPNLNEVEIDNTISSGGCTWGINDTIKLIGWNAERGTHWDKFYKIIQESEELNEPHVILMNEMDVGMARSGNVHTARRLALQLQMNYAYGVEFLELTRGTKQEQEATETKRDALSLHGNAILSKCIIGDAMILRDPLPHTYFSDRAHRGINANGFEVRLGGRMGLFARIFKQDSPDIPANYDSEKNDSDKNNNNNNNSLLPPHFVVGNVHKVAETLENREMLWKYYGFGRAPALEVNASSSNPGSSKYEGLGVDLSPSQHGVIVQGDFGPQFCALGGLRKKNNWKIHKTFRVECLPNGKSKIGPLSADFFCSNMDSVRDVQVTPPCDWSSSSSNNNNNNKSTPLTLADHAIVSIVVKSNKK